MYSNLNTTEYDTFNNDILDQINNIKKSLMNDKIVFTASSFDLFHSGHALMLEDASNFGKVVIALHNDPTINRTSKNNPIQSIEERRIIINSNKYVHSVIEYNTESDLYNILINLNPDLRMLGSDWKGKQYTGNELQIQIYFHERNHNWSTSNLRKRIFDAEYAKLLDIKEF